MCASRMTELIQRVCEEGDIKKMQKLLTILTEFQRYQFQHMPILHDLYPELKS